MVSLYHGDIAQQGERGVRNAEVGGSIPPISTNVAQWHGHHIEYTGVFYITKIPQITLASLNASN